MTENSSDPVVRLHREAVQSRQERQRAQLEALFEQAVQRQPEQDERDKSLVEQTHREAVERGQTGVLAASGAPRGVHYTELPEAVPGQPLADEWNTYRRNVGRWLGEGRGGVTCSSRAGM